MAKAVFHSNEIKPSAEKVFLDLPKKFAPVEPEEPEEAMPVINLDDLDDENKRRDIEDTPAWKRRMRKQ